MWSKFVNIDARWFTAVISCFIVLEIGIVNGTISLTNMIPADWIPYVTAWSKAIVLVAATVNGGQSIAALVSPWNKQPPKAA